MTTLGVASGAVFALSALFLGARLLALSAVRAAWPERLVGLSFSLIGLAYAALVAAAELGGGKPAALPLFFILAVFDVGFACLAAFSWYVFHRTSSAQSKIGVALIAGNVLVAIASPWMPAFADGAPGALPIRIALRLAIFVWSAITSLAYHSMMKRRLALGLADPIVVDRFRLWGLFMAGGAGILLTLTAAGVLRLHEHFLTPILGTAGLLLGWVCIGLLWLSFSPPRWYCDRVIARAPKPEDG